ncbi:MAG: toxin-antitoxin system YwqK family antitoxin, partial [Candidatus Omnitrophica bacterium]|nr:toxin-antitoxin system YwqK family antitoxin [Candidatus Omnitrophota bacterium]
MITLEWKKIIRGVLIGCAATLITASAGFTEDLRIFLPEEYLSALGMRVEGDYIDGKKEGYFRIYDAEEKVIDERLYRHGKLINGDEDLISGAYNVYYSNGHLFAKFNYNAGVLDGLTKIFNETGELLLEGDIDSKSNRASINIYEGGRITWALEAKEGELDGDIVKYHDNGNISAKYSYKDGAQHGTTSYFTPNGNVIETWSYENGERNGEYRKYYENGMLREAGVLKNGLLNGAWKMFYPNENVKTEVHYTDGQRNGELKEFYPDGNLKFTQEYRDDHKHGYRV